MALKTDIEQLDGGRKLPLVEDFYTIQGEGFHAGKPAYFIRLGGCDVDAAGATPNTRGTPGSIPPTDVRTVIDRATACPAQAIVITGGEPLLYPLGVLTETLHAKGLEIFLETSGTHPFSGVFRLGVSVAQAAATAAGRGVREGARTEGDRRRRG